MVNEEHYAWLNKGVQAWNNWRYHNLNIIPDLSDADLNGADLSDADLNGANLSNAHLSRTKLNGADLSNAHLDGADLGTADLKGANLTIASLRGANLVAAYFIRASLRGANLIGANLIGANLSYADLMGAKLCDADLMGANLIGANLIWVELSGANLNGANLSRLDLSGTDLSGANLSRANLSVANLSTLDLSGTDLTEANLSGANLSEANLSTLDLSGANLSGANLRGINLSGANLSTLDISGLDLSTANLSTANLSRTQALKTDFSNAKFTGACLEDWHINSATKLDDIDCQYVYLKSDFQERRPSSGEFTPGEFTKLFQKALETVDLIFTGGIDWKAFLFSFQELQAEYGEKNLSVQAIEKKSGGAFIIRLEVPPEANKADIESQAKALYEIQLKGLEARYHAELQAKNEQIVIYRQQNASLENVINILGNRPIQNIITVTAQAQSESMSETYQSKYDQRNSNNQFVDTAQSGSNPTFNQYNSSEQKKTLAEAASEIQKLLKQLEQTNPTATEAEKVAYVNDETTPSFKRRVVGALQAGGETVIDEFILENKYLKVAKATIKGWLQPGS
ncbi:MAG: pentapeptide repeat-containing protein [Nostoc sp.]